MAEGGKVMTEKIDLYKWGLRLFIGGMFGLGFLWTAHMVGWLYSLFMLPVRSVGWVEWMVVGAFFTGVFCQLMGFIRFSLGEKS